MALLRMGVATPSANTDTTVYTSAASYLTSVIATNTGSTEATARVWVVPLGASTAADYGYIIHDVPVPAHNSIESHRFAIQVGDVVKVRSNSSNMSFSVNGVYDGTSSIDTHLLQTTNVHGIANTANLATLTTTNALNDRLVAIELGLGIFD